MERFNYKNLKAVYREDVSILALLEAESYGYKKDQQEELETLKTKLDSQTAGNYG